MAAGAWRRQQHEVRSDVLADHPSVRTSADDAARDLAAARPGCDPALATFGVAEVYQRLERNGTTVIGGPS